MQWIVSSPWAYPALESLHIVGIGLLLGSLAVLDLRLWGIDTGIEPAALARLALPVTLLGFAMAATSGGLMFASQAGELLANQAFVLKMGLLACAGLNAAWFHRRGVLLRGGVLARLQTALSLGLWIGVIICGRWIAYR